MSSSVTATLTVVLVVLAGNVAMREEVLKSLPLQWRYYNMDVIRLATKLFAVCSEKLILTEIILFIIPPVIVTVTNILLSSSSPLKLSDANWILSTAEKQNKHHHTMSKSLYLHH